ncbi:golgin subfamily A member 4-like isoform X2 [Plodia interpunctella]|uniref:golgin subfamily A member 4-like isoform X2 n=1 Tax=Plodia interpunctella TaxID=58824 RepID=UPI002367ADE5|nr:golgin subfamily A member 4-like isoform X2 [Plodia interpunctella]
MASTARPQKEKSSVPLPRLTPRPTAASAARAARNATNRNLTQQPSQRQSPSRNIIGKVKSQTQRPIRTDSKIEVKINPSAESVIVPTLEVFVTPATSQDNSYPNNNTIAEDFNADLVHVRESFVIERNSETDTLENAHQESQEQKSEPLVSRPQSPVKSRPQTPKTSSRPQTPRAASRPTTPGHSSSRPATPRGPVSRPTTPRTAPSNIKPPSNIRSSIPVSNSQIVHAAKDDEDIKSLYTTKQRQFHRMKKELDLKQQAVLEIFDCLRSLRERMTREGLLAGGGDPQELVVFNVADWATDEVSQLCRDAASSSMTDGAIEMINTVAPIDEVALEDLENKVLKVPAQLSDLCLQSFTARQELIDWVKDLIDKNEIGSGEGFERIAQYNAQGLELCEALREYKSRADSALDTLTQLSKRASRERNMLITIGESLVREIARLRQDLESRAVIVSEMREIRAETDTARVLEDTRRELDEERAAKQGLKEKLATSESQLRQVRIRVAKMDRQLREAEASISSLTGTVKSLEDQSRQREVQLEARARKLKESLKTGELASSQIAHQRDSLQTEIVELKEQIENMTSQHKTTIQELKEQLKSLRHSLEEQQKLTEAEVQQKEAAQRTLEEKNRTIEELKTKVTELEESIPNPDLPTEREMDLWAELQATKETLRITEDEVTACKREKVRFLETLTKITESENKVGMQQKLAAELLSKEEIIAKMQIQTRELTKNIKLNEQKVIQYEQYVHDLQAHKQTMAKCQDGNTNGASYQELQQEIMKLRMGLLEAVHQKEELNEMLLQKEQQLEEQDKTSRAQVREELINMLKNKETEQSRELTALQQDLEHRMKIVDEVNKQIAAKADEIQELFTTLENKQQQIHRLEKIVLALEEQQRRAQAQRTRHEEKIAALEHELAAGGNRRERKYLFF